MNVKLENDYSNHYIHSGIVPNTYISNIDNPLEGYPKLQKLKELKQKQIEKHQIPPFGCKVKPKDMPAVITNWCTEKNLQFDVVMIGALSTESVLPVLNQLPLAKLCAKPGFLFIWTTEKHILELSVFLNTKLNKKFRRSEELIFIPVNKNSNVFPEQTSDAVFQNQQWHCWMCITGTVRRSSDSHLIHCNVDTDLQFETSNSPVTSHIPDTIYKVAENFSNSNRRLHIIPYSMGYNLFVRSRPGWVIMSPDVLLDNFDPIKYESSLYSKSLINNKGNHVQYLVSQTQEIEELRPKSPNNSNR
ncbi:regulatory protein [Yamadazyma tenuis]|uniref:Karyogamy protein KAR4 n=1 Tax=Candida tenuis (strain ATCC 10573 / BCRC 21748 / CBS 615 / JCM 9827 / NBRC 10315 / NRRL Y-1498 / VKM Y-70) TaxID=590646 RepID=G3BEA8_CANTC|nr:uncharacterized protein CANTEDRAFT_110179 [Yamadazyma tenuis ATCC 10573]EGV60504.1 hypothetical protein CANTEDRAFT_110179 [Yamadazyma tenuis ATCC 10573]WEJ94260.1 regulatory protein [Yamadazyma tenuis]